MQPHVLAIEPDLRQAAIVKRIVREKVLADVTVVDSRDAALEAMRTTVPDVLLLSALLSPRDEDELVAHLRTLEHAEHLQTHTIPQLASSIEHDDPKPAKGLLSSLWRRKGSGAAPAGCDPDLFAEEIRTYLKRASDKKREVRDGVGAPALASLASPRSSTAGARVPADAPEPSAVSSSWESPFEWRPAGHRETRIAAPEPIAEVPAGPRDSEPERVEAVAFTPEDLDPADTRFDAVAEPAIATPAEAVVLPGPEPVVVARPEPVVVQAAEPVLVARSQPVAPGPRPQRTRLVVRRAREWWYEEGELPASGSEPECEVREVLASLTMPQVAAVTYAEGCRIRRVRLTAA